LTTASLAASLDVPVDVACSLFGRAGGEPVRRRLEPLVRRILKRHRISPAPSQLRQRASTQRDVDRWQLVQEGGTGPCSPPSSGGCLERDDAIAWNAGAGGREVDAGSVTARVQGASRTGRSNPWSDDRASAGNFQV
jgi:hypothetical protein